MLSWVEGRIHAFAVSVSFGYSVSFSPLIAFVNLRSLKLWGLGFLCLEKQFF